MRWTDPSFGGLGKRGVPPFLTVCLDARRGKLYTRSYRYHEKGWRALGPARVLSIDALGSELPPGSWIAGDGVPKLIAKNLAVAPEKKWIPRAATLIELLEAKDPLLKKLKHPREFLPVYLRSSEAEEKLKDNAQKIQ